MKSRLYIAFLTLVLSFMLVPSPSHACGSKVEESCCNKEVSTTKTKKSCCKSEKKDKKDNGCNGKCGHSNCTTSTVLNLSIIAPFEMQFNNTNFDLAFKKSKFSTAETSISAGYTSVWSIPKIG